MRKLSLNLDSLDVESFTVDEAGARVGTVNGQSGIGFTDLASCIVCGTSNVESDCCTGTNNTIMVTCDTTNTMNAAASECMDATKAGYTCDGSVYGTCGLCTTGC